MPKLLILFINKRKIPWNPCIGIDTISFIVIAIVSHALPGTNVHWLNPCI